MDLAGGLLAVLALMLLALFAAVAATAIATIGRAKAHHFVEQQRGGAPTLLRMVEDPGSYVGALAALRVAALVAATIIMAELVDARVDGYGALITLLVMALVGFVATEAFPRWLAARRIERLGLMFAGPAFVFGRLMKPLAVVMRAPRRLLAGASNGEGDGDDEEDEEDMEEEERELIHSIFEFGDTLVREVMVPRTDMVVIKSDAVLRNALETVTKAGYSRIPIYEGDTDNIVGVLYAKDLLKRSPSRDGSTKVSELGRAPLFVPEQKKVADLLREMQQARIHMAIVVDEYGGTAGLVTIEDLIEEIVGEIVDEYDQEEPLVEPLQGDMIRVSAKLPIDEVNELLGVELPHDGWDTVGGLVFGLTGRVPVPGEKVNYDSLEFTTERVTGRRIQKIAIRKVAQEATPES